MINSKIKMRTLRTYILSIILLSFFNYATCKYSFKDTSPIPTEVKTFRVNYLENKVLPKGTIFGIRRAAVIPDVE